MAKDDKRIFADSSRCLACRACEIACALCHSECAEVTEAVLEQPRARPRVVVRETKGKIAPVQCMQCARPKCVEACEAGALTKDEESGLVVLDEGKCTGCWSCVEACPFHAIHADEERGVACKCDICGGDPACVAACPTGALFFGTRGEFRARSAEREPVTSGD
ncbi:MAG: 4Fe-4S dicluster domain-containing protein [Armatimonadota bacterium]|nr:MAG: 4Fe-4S dicluster domain-containing protein [Armatimonadota bacterium]